MSDYHINLFYSEEDGGYTAHIPDLKSCSAFGKTPEEALREVQLTKSAWLQTCRARKERDFKVPFCSSLRQTGTKWNLDGCRAGRAPICVHLRHLRFIPCWARGRRLE